MPNLVTVLKSRSLSDWISYIATFTVGVAIGIFGTSTAMKKK